VPNVLVIENENLISQFDFAALRPTTMASHDFPSRQKRPLVSNLQFPFKV